jgi:undecaprenyl-diphosphatase
VWLIAGVLLFVLLAAYVSGGETQALDRKLLLSMRSSEDPSRPAGPHILREVARDVTALGSVTVLTILIAAVGAYFVLDGRTRMGVYVWVSAGSGAILGSILKWIFQRPRPELELRLVPAASTSFPSGHSMLAAVSYLTLGVLLASTTRKRRLKVFFLALAVLLTVSVGVTRVYLGVHWPTDVLAGWLAGALWAFVCRISERWIGVEPPQ